MAHMEPMGLEALEKMASGLNTLTNDIDTVAQTCINAASPTMESIYKGTMAGASGSLGSAAASTATTPAKKNFLGDFAVSRPVGYSQSGHSGESWEKWEQNHRSRYGMIAAFFNYGVGPHAIPYSRPNKYGLIGFKKDGRYSHPGMKSSAGATGWHDRAAKAAEGPVKDIVDQKFESEVKRLTGA